MIEDRILAAIKKNYDKAMSCKEIGSEAEALAFMDAAQRLLNKHKLEMTEVEWRLEQKNDPVKMHKFEPEGFGIKKLNERVTWTEQLAWVIANENGCDLIVLFDSNAFWLVGSRHNRMVTEWLIGTMITHAQRLCAEAKAEATALHPSYALSFDENFYYGFVSSVHARYQQLKLSQFQGVDRSKALIRLSQEKALVKQFMDKLGEKTVVEQTTSKAVAVYENRYATAAGQDAAESVPLQVNVLEAAEKKVQRQLTPGDGNG